MPAYAVEAGELYFYERGRGPLTLFLHGGPLDHRIFLGQIDKLAATRRCVAPDLRGFGRSSSTYATEIELEAHAADVSALLLHLGGDSADVVGLSLGGHVAIALARRHPEVVRSLSLVSTSTSVPTPERKALIGAMGEQVLDDGRRALGIRLADHMLIDGGSSLTRSQLLTMVEGTPYETIAATYRWIATRQDDTEILRHLDVPTLLVAGDLDPSVPVKALDQMVNALPDGRALRLAGAGHLLSLEASSELNDVLVEFWGSVDQP